MKKIKPIVTDNRVIFGSCRLSYTHLFAKYDPNGSPEGGKYMTNVLIPKSDKATVDALNSAIEHAKNTAIAGKWGGKLPKKLDLALRDGDEKDDPVYKDHWYINAKSSTRPGVVDKDRALIMDAEEVYSGMWAVVSVTFYGYDVSGNRGIAAGLNHVMKTADGERLGGQTSAESEFAKVVFDDEDDDDL